MGTDMQLTFRTPLILLAMADLAILGARLWPWQDVMSLPGNGATGLDPAVSLVAYIVLGFWITNTRVAPARKSLFSAAMLGLVAGLLLAAQVMLAARPPAGDGSTATIQMVLMAAAALVCGFAGLKASRTGVSLGFSAVCAAWAAMVACLIACAVILVQGYFAMGPPESPDPWKQYEGLAIGTPATQALVHSLNSVTGFLLIGPIVGCLAGFLFAKLGPSRRA
jgi:hypothetical protein